MSKHFIFQGPLGSDKENSSGKPHPIVRSQFPEPVCGTEQ